MNISNLSIEELEQLKNYVCKVDIERINNILRYRKQEMGGRIIKDNEVIEKIVKTILNPIDSSSVCGAATLAEAALSQSSIEDIINDN